MPKTRYVVSPSTVMDGTQNVKFYNDQLYRFRLVLVSQPETRPRGPRQSDMGPAQINRGVNEKIDT